MKTKFNKKIYIFLIAILIITGLTIYYMQSNIVHITDEDIAMSGGLGITPQMFGAKGDGKNNDTKAIQKAIDYASKNTKHNTVFLPEGTYSVRNLFLKQNVILIGEEGKSILLADPSCKTWDGILQCKNLDSVNITGITFDGNKPIVPGNTEEGTPNMWITSCKNVNIKNCTFQNNFYSGIIIEDSSNINISSNRFIELDCGVITSWKPSNDITISSNYFDGAEYSEPIAIFGSKEGYHINITITDNVIKNHTKGSGIGIRAAKKVAISNNIIENCGTGIYFSSAEYNNTQYGVYDVTIENNTIKDCVYEGILASNLNDSKIVSNNIENSGSFSILTKYVDNSEFSENKIIESKTNERSFHGFSMSLNGISNSTISNNIIYIKDKNINIDRTPIVVGSSSNNRFENNYIENDDIKFENIYSYRSDAINNTYGVIDTEVIN